MTAWPAQQQQVDATFPSEIESDDLERHLRIAPRQDRSSLA